MNKNKLLKNINSTILTILLIGIVILLNIIFAKYTYNKDITNNKIFKLSDKTISVLKDLDKSGKKVNAYIQSMYDLDYQTQNMISGLLKQYQKNSKSFYLKTIDYERNPALAQKYGVSSPYQIVFTVDNKTKLVDISDMYVGNTFSGEQVYTSAINSLINENPPVLYFITGHKEVDPKKEATYLSKYIELEGFVIKSLNLLAEGKIPNDADLIVDFGAKSDFNDNELGLLKTFAESGKGLVFLTSSIYDNPKLDNLNKFFGNYGLKLNNDIVKDNQKNFFGNKNMISPVYGDSSIVNNFKESNYYMIMPAARSIQVLSNDNYSINPLLSTSSDSWGETDIEQDKAQIDKIDNNDIKGPLNVAVHVKGVNNKTNMIVVGNDLFVFDKVLQTTQSGACVDFVLNSFNELGPKKETVSISAKAISQNALNITNSAKNIIFILVVLIIPGLVLILGIYVWLRRRNK